MAALQKQTRDKLKHMLKEEDVLNHETSAKTGGSLFSCSCDTQYQNTLPSQFFMIELRLSLGNILLVSKFFQQAAEENMCPLTQVFTW